MSENDRRRWDKKYAKRSVSDELAANDWLLQHIDSLPPGRALDLATGLGHSAIVLARSGWDVTAIDISMEGLQRAVALAARLETQVSWIAADLDSYPLPHARFDLITMFHYLARDVLPAQIVDALRPGGVLVYETFTLDQLHVPGNHLTNPNFLLRPGELLTMFAGLRTRHHRDVILPDRAVASLVAEKPSNTTRTGHCPA